MFSVAVKDSVYFALVHDLVLQNHILVLHVVVVPHPHSRESHRLNLGEGQLAGLVLAGRRLEAVGLGSGLFGGLAAFVGSYFGVAEDVLLETVLHATEGVGGAGFRKSLAGKGLGVGEVVLAVGGNVAAEGHSHLLLHGTSNVITMQSP